MTGGNDGFLQSAHSQEKIGHPRRAFQVFEDRSLRRFFELGQVGPGAEILARATQNNDVALIIGFGFDHCVAQFGDDPVIERVAFVRTVERDERDAVSDFVDNFCVLAHRSTFPLVPLFPSISRFSSPCSMMLHLFLKLRSFAVIVPLDVLATSRSGVRLLSSLTHMVVSPRSLLNNRPGPKSFGSSLTVLTFPQSVLMLSRFPTKTSN